MEKENKEKKTNNKKTTPKKTENTKSTAKKVNNTNTKNTNSTAKKTNNTTAKKTNSTTKKTNTTSTKKPNNTTTKKTSDTNTKKTNTKKEATGVATNSKSKTTTNNKKTTTKNKEKEKKTSKFIQIIKKKWLIDGTRTLILVVAIIAIFIAISLIMQKQEFTPIDLSQEKLYTISDEIKEKIKNSNIDKDVNIYFIGSTQDDLNAELSKQFTKVNEHIKTEIIENTEDRPDLAEKYGIDKGSQGIIVACGEKSKVLTSQDLVSYSSEGDAQSVADQKLASAIITVTSDKVPKVYFLNGYSEYSLNNNMNYLSMYLANEVTEVDSVDLLTKGKVPDDCDTLIITTPNKDFDDVATKAILDYIKSGRNILWFNAAIAEKTDLPNVNKVLAEYGVKPFEVGAILETDDSKMVSQQPYIIIPEVQYSTVTKKLYNTSGALLINATKINLEESEELEKNKITSTTLLQASEKSFFRNDFSNQTMTKTDKDSEGPFVVGAELEKTIEEAKEDEGKAAKTSKLIIYGENNFITDLPLSSSTQNGAIQYAYNKDIPVDSISYLVDREEDIISRKSTGAVTYTATEEQSRVILAIIFGVPLAILITGIVVFIVRRRKK